MGIAPLEERMRKVSGALNLPENILPFALIAVGYPGEIKKAEDRYEESRVHYNRY